MKRDPEGYRYYIKIYKNKGHWMDNLEASAFDWMSDFISQPIPQQSSLETGQCASQKILLAEK